MHNIILQDKIDFVRTELNFVYKNILSQSAPHIMYIHKQIHSA